MLIVFLPFLWGQGELHVLFFDKFQAPEAVLGSGTQ